MGEMRIGISGWRYARWRSDFYPKGLPQRLELAFAARAFPSIELNGSFYSLQRPSSWTEWRDASPEKFMFAVKGPRFVTHMKRLRNVESAMANFFASGLLALNAKLGPILWQLPPNMQFDEELIEAFISNLPRSTAAALESARHHDERLDGRSFLEIDRDRPMRHAMEVRHDSFVDARFVKMLRRHGVALVVADTAGRWPDREDVTADFVYVRLHGAEELYASGYTDPALDDWSARIDAWAHGSQVAGAKLTPDAPAPRKRSSRDVFCYFDNDMKVHAPYDAAKLMQRLKLPVPVDAKGKFTLKRDDLEPAADRVISDRSLRRSP